MPGEDTGPEAKEKPPTPGNEVGSAGEEDIPGGGVRWVGCSELRMVGKLASPASCAVPTFTEMGEMETCCSPCASSAIMAETLGKRSAGSLAMLRMIIVTSAGGAAGLINTGEAGIVLRCCSMMVAESLPGKGGVPAQIS